MGTIQYLQKNFALDNATEIMLTGGSSGASAALQYSYYLSDYFPSQIKLLAISDAGFFVDTYNYIFKCNLYRYAVKTLIKTLSLSSLPMYSNCKFTNEDFWKCFMIEYFYKSITIPVFFLQSQDDYQQLIALNGVYCIDLGLQNCTSDQLIAMVQNREHLLKKVFEIRQYHPNWGFWMRTCFEHTYHQTWGWYGQSMNVFSADSLRESNARDALYEWYDNLEGEKKPWPAYIDLVDWKHNPLCRYGTYVYRGYLDRED